MRITRYYISQPDANYGERFWDGERFTCWIDNCKVYVNKSAASKCLVKLVNTGYKAEVKESRYSI